MAKNASFDVLAVVLLMFNFFWNVMLCHWVSFSRLFEGLQSWTLKTICSDPLKYQNLCTQPQSINFQELDLSCCTRILLSASFGRRGSFSLCVSDAAAVCNV